MEHPSSTSELDNFPENSQGGLADNPETLTMWTTGDIIVPSEWPYLMLCRDQADGSLTWHMLCNEHDIPRSIARGMQKLVDDFISSERDRNLRGIELLCRYGNQRHMFLD